MVLSGVVNSRRWLEEVVTPKTPKRTTLEGDAWRIRASELL